MHNFSQERKTTQEIYIQPATDLEANDLGWAVSVLLDDGARAEYMVLQHCIHTAEALCVKQGIFNFLETERHMLATLAYPTEVWEWIALVPEGRDIYWTAIEGTDLAAFRKEQYPLSFHLKDWHPNLPSSYSQWFEKYCGPNGH